jgi:precorrin-8X/cobalt-precorrin-8 methylmutase
MTHTKTGQDGRTTFSFIFDDEADRRFWIARRNQPVMLRVIALSDEPFDANFASGDEDNLDYAPHEPGEITRRPVELQEVARSGATFFDDYLFVDWSAMSRPKTGKDSVWIAAGSFNAENAFKLALVENPATRDKASTMIRDWILGRIALKRRVLVGFDFPYGLPAAGYARLRGVVVNNRNDYWRVVHERIEDGQQNQNNRFSCASDLNGGDQGPFWGVPASCATTNLRSTKPDTKILPSEFRAVESALRRAGKRPFSVWQLYGNGAVGSQALLGIPRLRDLTEHESLADHSFVWPFESGWASEVVRPLVVHAEIWPGAIDVNLGSHPIKDAAQMLSLLTWAALQDVEGALATQMRNASEHADAQAEGWILGVP